MERAEVKTRFPSVEDVTLGAMFAELVEKSLQQCKGVGLAYLQAEASTGSITRPRNTASTAKKETIMLLTCLKNFLRFDVCVDTCLTLD